MRVPWAVLHGDRGAASRPVTRGMDFYRIEISANEVVTIDTSRRYTGLPSASYDKDAEARGPHCVG